MKRFLMLMILCVLGSFSLTAQIDTLRIYFPQNSLNLYEVEVQLFDRVEYFNVTPNTFGFINWVDVPFELNGVTQITVNNQFDSNVFFYTYDLEPQEFRFYICTSCDKMNRFIYLE